MGIASSSNINTLVVTQVTKEALSLCEAGDFHAARRALAEFWPPTGRETDAELLVAQGMIANGLGDLNLAEDLFSRGHRLAKGDPIGHRGLIGLAVVAWKRGELSDARVWVDSVPDDSPHRFGALTQKAIIEKHDPKRALAILSAAEPLAEKASDALRGRFHNYRGIVLRALADSIKTKAKSRKASDYRTRAAFEYEAALYFFEQADAYELRRIVFINLIGLYLSGGKYAEAHEVADATIQKLRKDPPHLGMVLDQKANVYLAEQNYPVARVVAEKAVGVLSNTDRQGWFTESLITLATILARQGEHHQSRETFDHAIEICERIGDKTQADKARIAIINELPVTCEAAFDLFLKSQSSCLPASKALIRRIEAEGIRAALDRHKGSVYMAAQEFDLTPQGLAKRIDQFFPHLTRKPKRSRRWKVRPA